VQDRIILINFLLFSAAVQFCKGRYTNTSLWLWLWLWLWLTVRASYCCCLSVRLSVCLSNACIV